MQNEILRWLRDTHRITVPTNWLSECLEWLQHDEGLSRDRWRNGVYQQWLIADLHQLESGCLPDNLRQLKDTTIRGHFPLQVDYVLDISRPLYQQYLKLKNVVNSNVNVTADTDRREEIDNHRVLQLHLSDGVQDVVGLEYRPIPGLSVDLAPGIKVMIKGEIRCANGALMLSRENVEVLGGEVCDLSACNSQIALMESRLNVLQSTQAEPDTSLVDSKRIRILTVTSRALTLHSHYDSYATLNAEEKLLETSNVTNTASTRRPANVSRNSDKRVPISKENVESPDYDMDDDEDFLNAILSPPFQRNSSASPAVISDDDDEEFEALLRSASSIARQKQVVSLGSLLPRMTTEDLTATIKGFVFSFVGGLRTNNGQSWGFTVIIKDDTAAVEAEFSNDVITEVMGMNAMAFKSLKKLSNTRPEAKQQLNELVEKFRRRMMNLSCLFDIRSQNAAISITKITEVTASSM